MIKVNRVTKIYQSHIRQNNMFKDIFFRTFKEHEAVSNLTFEVDQGEFVGFIGPNGAGKTTTLKMLAGILTPTSGSIAVWGGNPFDKKHAFLKNISFIMGQRNQLIWDLPAEESFILQKAVYAIDDHQYKKTRDTLTAILRCEHLVTKPVKTLSLGERMKMEFIASLLHRPQLVFLDEPTIGLDIFSQEAIREFIKEYQREYRATVILTSHYLEDVRRLAKRLLVIDKGHLVYDGTLKDMIAHYSGEKQIKITLERPVPVDKLQLVGPVQSALFPQVVYSVQRTAIPEVIKKIADLLPFTDLTVEDPNIEEVIKSFFANHKLHKDSNPQINNK